ncbi:ABC transporter permease subunit [Pseudonocardia parietis]|uniref:ABC-2 family transporter n=1 Tax=Pseudonocardia parietis TaxID=570936 RepID=A0ABS4VU14_9PSEU|nr:ABC transporter permease subunit [Pseudonocardia parietis]MBP2367390.1 hypothetical protein [Pseudonocardia parietis]
MSWVIWRRHRTALVTTAGLAGTYCLVLAVLAATGTVDTVVRDPFDILGNPAADFFGYLMLAAPALAGAFVGAPLLAGDLERGTHVLLLTQSVSRRRWAASVLLVGGAVVAAAVSVVAAVYLGLAATEPWADPRTMAATGLIPLARTLSAFALGALLGLLLRRVLASAASTLAAVVVTEVAVAALRGVAVPAELRTGPLPYGGTADEDTWVVDRGYTLAGGGMRSGSTGTGCTQDDVECLQAHGVDGSFMLVHPIGDRWPLHWVPPLI